MRHERFTRTISVSISITISVKIYHCVNGNGLFDGQNWYRTHSDRQMVRLHLCNVNLVETKTERETVRVNRP